MQLSTEVGKVFERIIRAVQDEQEVLASAAQVSEDKITQAELYSSAQKAQLDQLSAEVSQHQRDGEEKDAKLQTMTDENRNLSEQVRQLEDEITGLRQQLLQIKLSRTRKDAAQDSVAPVASAEVSAAGAPGATKEACSSSRSSSPSSFTVPPKAEEASDDDAEDEEEEEEMQEPPEAKVTEDTAANKEEPIAAASSSPRPPRERSRSRPLTRGQGRLRSVSPSQGDHEPQPKSSARHVTKRSDSRRPLARHQTAPSRHARSRASLPPPPPLPERGRARQATRDKVCFQYCARGKCASGDECPLRHPPKEDADKIMRRVETTACRDGNDCTRPHCYFAHPGSNSGGKGKRVKRSKPERDRRR
ncbi:unnamed protein product [Symbiodinium sp. CCMP2456]|nr:unnamed protein product [Symbiodinium sp. CCMP2456]